MKVAIAMFSELGFTVFLAVFVIVHCGLLTNTPCYLGHGPCRLQLSLTVYHLDHGGCGPVYLGRGHSWSVIAVIWAA